MPSENDSSIGFNLLQISNDLSDEGRSADDKESPSNQSRKQRRRMQNRISQRAYVQRRKQRITELENRYQTLVAEHQRLLHSHQTQLGLLRQLQQKCDRMRFLRQRNTSIKSNTLINVDSPEIASQYMTTVAPQLSPSTSSSPTPSAAFHWVSRGLDSWPVHLDSDQSCTNDLLRHCWPGRYQYLPGQGQSEAAGQFPTQS